MEKGIIVSLDMMSLTHAEDIVRDVMYMPEVSGFKVGSILGLSYGLHTVMNRLFPDLYQVKELRHKLIFDYQKAGNDISAIADNIMSVVALAHFSHAIIFPFTSSTIGRNWINAATKHNLTPIVGHRLTEKSTCIHHMLAEAWDNMVRDFVISGTDLVSQDLDMNFLYNTEKEHVNVFVPGIGAQGGSLKNVLNKPFGGVYPIIGRSIYDAQNPKETILKLFHEELFLC